MQPFADVFPAENIHHHFVGQDQARGLYAKELHIPAGFTLLSHSHPFDHLSILASGSVRWGDQVLVGPCAVTVEAGVKHSLQALTEAVWFCVHAMDEADPDRVDAVILERGEL